MKSLTTSKKSARRVDYSDEERNQSKTEVQRKNWRFKLACNEEEWDLRC